MIAVAKPKPVAIEVGDLVRMEWPESYMHGKRGVVKTIDGSRIGVSWPWGKGGVSTFYAIVSKRRLRVLKPRKAGS